MTLTRLQIKAIEMIKKMEEHFGVRWFVQAELEGISLHTMNALVSKGQIEQQTFAYMSYYRFKG